jgi:small subunit ribosomal protein S2
MRELLESGVHFGHQTRRWNPKMRRFIFAERAGLYLIDLQQTIELIETAHSFVRNVAERGGSVLFVGTKKQTQDSIRDEATRVGMPFVNHRWLGGLLTNHRTIQSRITRMHDLRRLRADGQLELLPPKERMSVLRELEKLEINLGGVAEMRRLPQAVFVIDLKKEALAIREARRCNIPVIGLVDTNCDPDEAQYVIPGNDDAIRSCGIVARVIADGVAEGQGVARAAAAEIAAAQEAAAAAAAAEAEAAAAAAEAAAAASAAEAAPAPDAAETASAPASEA